VNTATTIGTEPDEEGVLYQSISQPRQSNQYRGSLDNIIQQAIEQSRSTGLNIQA